MQQAFYHFSPADHVITAAIRSGRNAAAVFDMGMSV
jgi:hypothetical protein